MTGPRELPRLHPVNATALQQLRRAAPHPTPIPILSHPAFYGHYYQGVNYTGPAQNVSSIEVSLRVPADLPETSDFYYVLVSIWDDAGSYDQIGFANNYGVWGLTYSYTSQCAGTYYFNPSIVELQPGGLYSFYMSIASGNVTYIAYNENATVAWNSTFQTGGTRFVESGTATCNGSAYVDYTDYEEIYSTNAPVPPYEFVFQHNLAGGTEVNAWSNLSLYTSFPIAVLVQSNAVAIENEPYSVAVVNWQSFYVIERNGTRPFLNASVNVIRDLGAGAEVNLTSYYLPGGWNVSFQPNTGRTPFTTHLTLKLPANSPPESDYLGVNASDGSGSYTRTTLAVELLSHVQVSIRDNTSRSFADVGQSVRFQVTPSQGLGPYSVAWANLPPGCAPPAGFTVACVLAAPSASPILVNVTDALGETNHTLLPFVVAQAPTLEVASIFPVSRSLDVGQTLYVNLTAVGGAGGVAYSWGGLSSCPTVSTPNYVCTVTTSGWSNLTVYATDLAGVGASVNLVIQVFADPVLPSLSISRTSLDVGQPLSISAAPVGGSGGDDITWFGLPPGCTGTGPRLTCTPSAPGSYSVTATVSDSNSYRAVSPHTKLTVTQPPLLSLPPVGGQVYVGGLFSISATESGGQAPFQWRWLGLPHGCSSPAAAALSCTPDRTGSFNVTVEVVDANGANATNGTRLQVLPVPAGAGSPATGGSSFSGLTVPLAVLAVGLLVAGVGWVVWHKRRARGVDGIDRPPAATAGASGEPDEDTNAHEVPAPQPYDATEGGGPPYRRS
ncbi:MAG: hypothetical protein L3K23_02080 [Thermoplasmata archaeon]|nr:hypothetical protein [Thermoplasmata archaeon]